MIKAEIKDPRATSFDFIAIKTMYGGKTIRVGDNVYVFASENEGGKGLIAKGVVTAARAVPKNTGVARQTPRVTIAVQPTDVAKRRCGRNELKTFNNWGDGKPGTELNFKFYRQATNKLAAISDETAAFLDRFF